MPYSDAAAATRSAPCWIPCPLPTPRRQDVEHASRLAVERLSSPAARVAQAVALLTQAQAAAAPVSTHCSARVRAAVGTCACVCLCVPAS